jgi:hypothetical protein
MTKSKTASLSEQVPFIVEEKGEKKRDVVPSIKKKSKVDLVRDEHEAQSKQKISEGLTESQPGSSKKSV